MRGICPYINASGILCKSSSRADNAPIILHEYCDPVFGQQPYSERLLVALVLLVQVAHMKYTKLTIGLTVTVTLRSYTGNGCSSAHYVQQ